MKLGLRTQWQVFLRARDSEHLEPFPGLKSEEELRSLERRFPGRITSVQVELTGAADRLNELAAMLDQVKAARLTDSDRRHMEERIQETARRIRAATGAGL